MYNTGRAKAKKNIITENFVTYSAESWPFLDLGFSTFGVPRLRGPEPPKGGTPSKNPKVELDGDSL